ncbi:SGNH/GDSL hydrolase family protein [Nocardia sp. JMUB6875]
MSLGCTVILGGAGASAVPAPDAQPVRYVAMGDSAAAGPLIWPQADWPCARAERDWPRIVAERLGVRELTDVTCSGATIQDFSHAQATLVPSGSASGSASPTAQFDALSELTDLVTVEVGGNDIGTVGVGVRCLDYVPGGADCARAFNADGDEIARRIEAFRPKYAAMLTEIHRRAPKARVVTVGYGTYLPLNGCDGQPFRPESANYLQGMIFRLDQMIADESAADRPGKPGERQAQYVDIATPSRDHNMCAAPQVQWFYGVSPKDVALTPFAGAAPLHPTALGMQGIAEVISAAIMAGTTG